MCEALLFRPPFCTATAPGPCSPPLPVPVMIPSTICALFFLLAAVHAVPLQWSLEKRDVISPPVTSPDASTTWNVGETVTVTWYVVCLHRYLHKRDLMPGLEESVCSAAQH